MKKQRRLLNLQIVATDNTFVQHDVRGSPAWVGKCLHCNARLVVELDGSCGPDVTLEHILPRTHGGDNDLRNVALACARCNQQKGVRHDHKHHDDDGLRHVVALLQARRAARWRG